MNNQDQQGRQNLISYIATLMFHALKDYFREFDDITHRAAKRFQEQDWLGIQADSRQRLRLYKNKVKRIASEIRFLLKDQRTNLEVWKEIKEAYHQFIDDHQAYELAETFFNSVCRKIFPFMGKDERVMFSSASTLHFKGDFSTELYRTYYPEPPLANCIRELLSEYDLGRPYENLEADVQFICYYIEEKIGNPNHLYYESRIEVLKSVFYRNKGAYLIGRFIFRDEIIPFVLPILHGDHGLYVDALLTEPNDVSIIFSFTRSYFMVQVDVPSRLINFIRTLIPLKGTGEIYNSIGFNKHGKTEFYRDFVKHLQKSDDQFIIAPGVRGMVMSVFTLPSYNIVFKLIKDKFDPPKTVTPTEVKEKYKLVKEHDRVGRMADTHEFDHFEFDKDRFSPQLLEELQKVAPSILEEKSDKLIIKHLYTERKMIPLNIYLENANLEEAEEAVNEYGNAIKQLAAGNIFPGDMLLKNFGVTRHRRVIFYDYDEIMLLTECNFRKIPEPRHFEDEFSDEPWYTVGPNDIFPEEFRGFLIGRRDVRQFFFDNHSYLFEVDFWKEMQAKQNRGEVVDVYPYRKFKRFRNLK